MGGDLRQGADARDSDDGVQGGEWPTVSAIVATFNAEQHLADAVASILEQDYPGELEVVISDDGSTDETLSVANRLRLADSRVKIVGSRRNEGSAAARNRALGVADGTYVAIQDADDISAPSRIRTLVRELEHRRSFGFASSGLELFDERGVYSVQRARMAFPRRWAFTWGTPYAHGTTVFRSDSLVAVGGYRVAPETRRGQDYDLFMRLAAKGIYGVNLQEVLYSYRVDRETLKRRTLKASLQNCVIRWKGFRSLGLMPWAVPFVLKPVAAQLVNKVRKAGMEARRRDPGGLGFGIGHYWPRELDRGFDLGESGRTSESNVCDD